MNPLGLASPVGAGALLAAGAGGLPGALPLDPATIALPASPNLCVAAPGWWHGRRDLETPPLGTDPDRAWAAVAAMAAAQPRTTPHDAWPDRHQAQWVVRTAVLNFPDLVTAALLPHSSGWGLWLLSRSLFGHYDFGANRRRVGAWLAALPR